MTDLNEITYRHYENDFPEEGSLVMVEVKSVTDMGIYVTLLEYGQMEGMIPLGDWTQRRVRSLSSIVRVGRIEVARVTRVDRERGYIDLTKRQISVEEIYQCEEQWNKTKTVRSILIRILRKSEEKEPMSLEDAQKQWVWPLYRQYGHAYDAFMDHLEEIGEWDLPEWVVPLLQETIRKRKASSIVKIRCEMDIRCYHHDGIDKIREILIQTKNLCSDGSLSIHLVASPLYTFTITCMDVEMGRQLMKQAQIFVQHELTKVYGTSVITQEIYVVGQKEEQDLTKRLQNEKDEEAEEMGDI